MKLETILSNWDDKTQMNHISYRKFKDVIKYQFINPYGLIELISILIIGIIGGICMVLI